MSGKSSKASVALLSVVFLVVLFRAKSQSFTIDEARTFSLYVDRPLSEMAASFDACNHGLHTLITKFFRWLLGSSELVLRLSSVAGCVVYFTAVYKLSRTLFGEGVLLFAAVAALTLNPLMLDFCVASRGYGLALGLLLWTIYFVLKAIREEGDSQSLRRSGVLAGLCVAANLTCVVPLLALSTLLLAFAVRLRFWRRLDAYLGPAIIIAFLFLILPLAKLENGSFYVGHLTWRASVGELLEGSFRYSPLRSPGLPPVEAAAILFTLFVGAGAFAFVRALNGAEKWLPLALFGGCLALSVLTLTLFHKGWSVPYPVGRTGLYLIPLWTVTWALTCQAIPFGRVRWVPTAVLGVLALLYLAQIDVRFFAPWRFDASTRDMMAKLKKELEVRKSGPTELGTSWQLKPTVNYYRQRYRLNWLPASPKEKDLHSNPFDYYLLTGSDRDLLDKLKLRVLLADEVSGTVLAARN